MLRTENVTEPHLGARLVSQMNELTFARIAEACLDNAANNRDRLDQGKSLAALRREAIGKGDSAVVIAAGPSVRKQDPARRLREANYQGAVVCADSATSYCLRSGLVPDLIVSVDPQEFIIRWFGDPALSASEVDGEDYFRRQDLDDRFVGADELAANQELLELVNTFGPKLRIAIATTSHPRVVQRCLDAGMQVFFWNPMFDDPEDPQSITAALQQDNRMPSVNAGGNVGTSCWMMAQAVLGKEHVAVTGMDLGYYGDTPYERTQYYYVIRDLVGEENMDKVFMRIFNPHLGQEFLTDPAYRWYREVFLEMASDAACTTWNCTEGGILFGDSIDFRPLADFLELHGKES